MEKLLIDQDIALDVDKRLVKKLWKVTQSNDFPTGVKFVYQYLYFRSNQWQQMARIDNMLHKGKPGVHIHTLKREKVEWQDMTFEEAEEKILEYGEKVINNIIDKI